MASSLHAQSAVDSTNEVALSIHSIGLEQLSRTPGLNPAKKILSLPSTAALRKVTMENVSAVLERVWRLPGGTNVTERLAPLLDDVFNAETWGRFDREPDNFCRFTLAIRLTKSGCERWQTNLNTIFGSQGGSYSTNDFTGWRWPVAGGYFWLIPEGDWLVCGKNQGDTADIGYLTRIRTNAPPGLPVAGDLLEAEINWPVFSQWLPKWAAAFQPASIHLAVTKAEEDLRVAAEVHYASLPNRRATMRQLPMDEVRAGLISFTTGWGLGDYVHLTPAITNLGGDFMRDQFYAWALNQTPFQSYLAWPVLNASNVLTSAATNAPNALNPALQQLNHSKLVWQEKGHRLLLSNLHVMTPTLENVKTKTGEFLVLSLFPHSPSDKPAPMGLWKQIVGHPDLIYYDWELTGPRLQQWRLLGSILFPPPRRLLDDMMDAKIIGDRWVGDLSPVLGNSVTEVTRRSATELDAVRTAPAGLTGVEIYFLTRWLTELGSQPVAIDAIHP